MKDVEIGVITSASGIKGEVKVKSFAEDPARFRKISAIALRHPDKGTGSTDGEEYEIEHVRMSGSLVVLKLAGIDDRDAAEKLRSYEVFMDSDDLEPLPEGEHYIRDMIGLEVRDAETGEVYGKLSDVLTDRPQDVYVVKKPDGSTFMIPAVPEFVTRISEDDGVIEVKLIDGMI